MSRWVWVVAMVVGLAPLARADELERGAYYRTAKRGFELWLPKGFTPSADRGRKPTDHDWSDAEFDREGTETEGLIVSWIPDFSITDLEIAASRGTDKIRIVDRLRVGGRPALTLVLEGLDEEDYPGGAVVEGCVAIGGGIARFTIYLGATEAHAALDQIRWILATFRLSGPGGLDPWLGGRRIDTTLGLGYRAPLGMQPSDVGAIPGFVYAGVDAARGVRLTVRSVDAKSADEALAEGARGGKRTPPFRAAPSGFDVLGELDPAGDDREARARFAVQAEAGDVYVVELTGGTDGPALLRTAELVAMGLTRVDVARDREAVAAAVPAFEKAVKAGATAEIHAGLEALEPRAYLPEGRDALCGALDRLPSWRDVVRVVDVLAAECDPVSAEAILKLTRDRRFRSPPELVVALLRALGVAGSPKAIPALVRAAKEGPRAARVAAIDALGRYLDEAAKVVGELVSIMRRAEKEAKSGGTSAQVDWDMIRPACARALHNLTGQPLDDAAAATAWLKSRR